jgi:membrane associated rhomboid family serine protease
MLMEHWRDLNYRALGASGAVSGVTMAAALIVPTAIFIFFFVPMPAIIFAVLFIGYSAWASRSNIRDGIGHAAHLGGALTGVALMCIFWPAYVQQGWQKVLNTLPAF